MSDQNKEFEISVGYRDATASLKFKNCDSHVGATIGEMMVDQLRWFRWKNAVRTLDKYNEMKRKRNLEGKEIPLPPKHLLTILENAFMEDDEDLHDRWVTLLVNGQDPERKIEIHPSYIDILRQLSSLDANLLAEFRPKTPFMQMAVSIKISGEADDRKPDFTGEPQLFNFPEQVMPIVSFYLSKGPTQKVLHAKSEPSCIQAYLKARHGANASPNGQTAVRKPSAQKPLKRLYTKTCRVGKRRLTALLRQVCADPSQNRTYPSQGIRLPIET